MVLKEAGLDQYLGIKVVYEVPRIYTTFSAIPETMAAMRPEVGRVRTQLRKMRPSRLKDTPLGPWEARPTKKRAPIWQCVVETGNSSAVAITTLMAEANSMQKALKKSTLVTRVPMVLITPAPKHTIPAQTPRPPRA